MKSILSVQSALSNPKTSAQECLKRLTVDAFRSRDSRSHKKLSEITDAAIQPMANGKPTTIVVPTGIPELDRVIGGYQPTLNLIGAEPGVGKSALFATSLDACSRAGTKSGFFSLEDDPAFLSYRLLSQGSGVNQFKLRFTKLADSDIDLISNTYQKTRGFQDSIIVVDGSDRPMSDDEISATANDLYYNHGVRIFFVDHLGEIVSRTSDRFDLEVSSQLSTLRRIANRLGVPVVVAAHFRRPANGGRIIKPVLTDFANSSGAERKARVALGLTREPGSDKMMIHVLKQTNGPSGMTIDVQFDGAAAMIINSEGAQKG
jgi:replicative DNA helicase